jgi:hypothetical protein
LKVDWMHFQNTVNLIVGSPVSGIEIGLIHVCAYRHLLPTAVRGNYDIHHNLKITINSSREHSTCSFVLTTGGIDVKRDMAEIFLDLCDILSLV